MLEHGVVDENDMVLQLRLMKDIVVALTTFKVYLYTILINVSNELWVSHSFLCWATSFLIKNTWCWLKCAPTVHGDAVKIPTLEYHWLHIREEHGHWKSKWLMDSAGPSFAQSLMQLITTDRIIKWHKKLLRVSG